MRFMGAFLLWLFATAALAVAVPAMWAQHNVVDLNGYSAFAASAARDPAVQQAVAAELTSQVLGATANSGYDADPNLIGGAVRGYTQGDDFPGQFALVNQVAHRWIFTDTVGSSDGSGRWEIDLGPILSDPSFRQTFADFGIVPPASLQVPLIENVSASLRPGQLRQVATWGPWVSVGTAVLAGVFALLTLSAAKSRGKAIVALGVSALIVGAAGWAGIEVGRRYVDDGLTTTTAGVRSIADSVFDHAVGSLHVWLNLTLAAGGALVVFGVLVSMLGGLRRRD